MHMTTKTLLAFALPLTLIGACGDDGGTDTTNAETSATDDTTTAGPTTDGPTTDGPTTTVDPDTTTADPDTTTADPDTSTGDPVGDATVRVMHLGVNAPGVDVFANGEGPVFTNLEFGNGSDYATVPAGEYTFDVSVTGMPVDEAVLTFMSPLAADTAYTAVALGDLLETDGDPELQVIAIEDDTAGIAAGELRIQVIHAAPAFGQVDIWEISGEPIPLLENVDFTGFETLDGVAAGPLEIGIDGDDDGEPDFTFSVPDLTPFAGQQVNVYASSDADGDLSLIAQLQNGTIIPILPN